MAESPATHATSTAAVNNAHAANNRTSPKWFFWILIVSSVLLALKSFSTSLSFADSPPKHSQPLTSLSPPVTTEASKIAAETDKSQSQQNVRNEIGREQILESTINEKLSSKAFSLSQEANNIQLSNGSTDVKSPEASSVHATQSFHKPLNILVFYGDDWRHDQLGHLNPQIHSPVIDHELAGKGIRFTHNCVTTSICGVSRATYITGQWMSRHGTRRTIDLIRPWNELFPAFLKKAGYHIGYCGKDGLAPFHPNKYDFCRLYSGYHIDETEDGGRHITQRAQDDAIEFLQQRPRDKPFYMTVAFYATHAIDGDPRQYIPMNQSMALYQDTVVPIPITSTDESWKRMPPFFNEGNEGRTRWHWRFDEPEKRQRMMKNYYRLVTEVDTAIGNVLNSLKEQGDLDNTLIIFTTDNGNFHSEHGLADKFYAHQESIRVPLIIRDPRMAHDLRNTTNDAFTLNVDLASTILSAANIPIPDFMQGRDIADLYLKSDAERAPWRQDFFYEFPGTESDWIPGSEALVRKDYKYIYWTDHKYEQLFDLSKDPIEDNDVFRDPSYQTVVEQLKKRFYEAKAEANTTRAAVQ